MITHHKKLLENEDKLDEVMPHEIWRLPEDVSKIVASYAIDEWLHRPFLFSGHDYAPEKALFLAEYAGPLDKFEFNVKSAIRKGGKSIFLDKTHIMGNRQGTLMQCLVTGLDYTDIETDEGMAERFLKIIKELQEEGTLPPGTLEKVEKQAREAAPLEDANVKQERESKNLERVHRLFDAIKQDDERITQQEIKAFNKFDHESKRCSMNNEGYLINNGYNIDRIHRIDQAIRILAARGRELPSTGTSDEGGWYGIKANKFCWEIIAKILQADLPPRVRQKLRDGIERTKGRGKRVIDVSEDYFWRKNALSRYNSHIDRFGSERNKLAGDRAGTTECFAVYYQQLQQYSKLMQKATACQPRVEPC